jgi:predicted RNase H-like nuclease (RuvC/YqgF family)
VQKITINGTYLKLDGMPLQKIKNFQYESNNCKRSLRFIMDENIHLKNSVSEILKNNGFDENLLDEIEIFHNRFIKEDELIGLLRNDVAELDKLLLREVFESEKTITEIDEKIKKLRFNVKNAEKEFVNLKSEFNSFLLENM